MKDKNRFGHLELDSGPSKAASSERPARTFEATEYVSRAAEQVLSGAFDEALRLYARALQQKPHQEDAWVGQLLCLVAVGDHEEAILWSEKALQYQPKSADITAARIMALARVGRTREAMETSDQSMGLSGQSALVWIARAWSHGADRHEPADRCVSKALEQSDNSPLVLLEVATFYMEQQRWTHALKHIQKLTSTRPALARPWYLAGLCQARMGMHDAALQALQEAHRLAPSNKRFRDAFHNQQNTGLLTSLWRRFTGNR
jgi:tetratricopeptide (TPR) repeat protein